MTPTEREAVAAVRRAVADGGQLGAEMVLRDALEAARLRWFGVGLVTGAAFAVVVFVLAVRGGAP